MIRFFRSILNLKICGSCDFMYRKDKVLVIYNAELCHKQCQG
ncbi:50S ribosomal protein L36 [Moraxella catarrhalis]|nr:50S ribosomal protein L36 [Moraxella catarrhalis]